MTKKRRPPRQTKRVKTETETEAEIDESLEETRLYYGLEARHEPHPLTPAGPKLKVLREQSGWTVSEIADRTGVPRKVLAAFENGDSAAASQLELSDLERLASACCGSVADLLTDVVAVRRALRRRRSRYSLDSLDSLF